MKRMTVAVAVLFVTACGGGGGEKGAPGDQGPTGEQGARGEPGYSGLVWVDANGALVGPYAASPTYVDDAGVLWPVDVEKGSFIVQTKRQYFQTSDCTGTGYFSGAPAAKQAFQFGREFFVRDGVSAEQRVSIGSSLFKAVLDDGGVGESCTQSPPQDQPCVPASATNSVTAPGYQFVGPLSIEAR